MRCIRRGARTMVRRCRGPSTARPSSPARFVAAYADSAGSRAASAYEGQDSEERYYCSFGLNPDTRTRLTGRFAAAGIEIAALAMRAPRS